MAVATTAYAGTPATPAYDSTGGVIGLSIGGRVQDRLMRTNPQKPLLFLGDSLTRGATLRTTNAPDHRPWWGSSTAFVNTNLGGTTWIITIALDGRAAAGSTGTLETDGAARLRWTFTGDTAGPWVDVSLGGFFILSSGTSIYQLQVACRNSTAANVTLPGAGSGAVSISGISAIISWELLGFPAWVAGAMGETFSDYQLWGISGDTTANLLSRTPQALAAVDPGAIVILIGTNDNPTTAALANTCAANIIATIDLCYARCRMVYVGDIFPRTDASATVRKYLALASTKVRDYCRTKPGIRFWSAVDHLSDPSALPVTLLTGAYHTDNLHLMPYGAYRASIDLVRQLTYDFMPDKHRKGMVDTYDATMITGAWNANPNLKGTAGTATASRGITGTVPDSWTLNRAGGAGGTQTCTTSFDTATDGTSWWSMSVANAGASDSHTVSQSVAIPAEIANGDLFRCVIEFKIFAAVAITSFQANALSNSNNIGTYAFWITRNLATFTTGEQPECVLASEPVTKIAGMTTITLAMRLGGAAASSGKVGIKSFRLEKVVT